MTNEALRERMLSGGAGGGERRPVEGAPGRDCRPMSICGLSFHLLLLKHTIGMPNALGLSSVCDAAATISR